VVPQSAVGVRVAEPVRVCDDCHESLKKAKPSSLLKLIKII